MSGGDGGRDVDVAGTIVESCKAQVDRQSETAIHRRGRDGTVTFKSDKRTHVSLSRFYSGSTWSFVLIPVCVNSLP